MWIKYYTFHIFELNNKQGPLNKKKMSKENQGKILGSYDENQFGAMQRQWNYPVHSTNLQQNRRCCSPADEIENMGDDDGKYSSHSVEVQTEKSTLVHLKQDKKIDLGSKKNFIPNTNTRDYQDSRKIHPPVNYGHDKIAERLANVNMPQVYDDYAEIDSEQPMDYTLCYNENNIDEEKKRSAVYINKTDFPCVEKAIEKEKVEAGKSKGAYSKESKNRKEMFSNPSRSFKEIFNFFKDRDKKRSIDQSKMPLPEVPKFVRPLETYEFKDKLRQPSQSPVEQSEKDVKSNKNETQYSNSQQTPLMFSRCSSLSSLSGFEQISLNDDRSSIVSDFSRRTSGVVSPSELPDSPAQSTPAGIRNQPKPVINFQGMKKTLFPQQDKLKTGQFSTPTIDNSSFQNDGYYKKPTIVKSSVFEDDLTSFKDESTPVLHSMAASSLSSLTIDDDDDDYDLINKIIINREKQTLSEEDTDDSSRKDPVGESSIPSDSSKPEIIVSTPQTQEENFIKEDEELAPFEEQLLDECVRTGIAKWTKQNINEIKPFSWDVGLICRSTRVMLTNTILEESEADFQLESNQNDSENKLSVDSSQKLEQVFHDQTKKQNSKNYSRESSEPNEPETNLNEEKDLFYGNSNYTTYEEHLLDQCIRRGISKKTRKNINSIRPFSWDVNQICLTTKAMMLRNRDDINFKGH